MKNLFFALIFLELCACSSLKTKERNQVQIDSIKKVAIIAYTVEEPSPVEIGFDLAAGLTGRDTGTMITQYDPHIDKMYDQLGLKLKENLKWQVLDKNTMVKNSTYVEVYKKTMDGWQNKTPPPQGYFKYNIKEIMDDQSVRIMGLTNRDKLIQELGVDALVMVKVQVHLDGTTVMGIGNRYPKSMVSWSIYKSGIETPVWFETVMSEAAKDSVGKTNAFDVPKMQKLAIQTSAEAYSQIK